MPTETPSLSAREAPPRPAPVLAVGADPALSPRLSAALASPVAQVDGYLLALGQIGTGGAPPLVVGRAEELDGEPEATVQALRALAPATRLVLLTQPEDEPLARRAVQAGFDQYLVEPVAHADLERALSSPLPEGEGAAQRRARGDAQSHAPPPSAPDSLGDIDLVDHLLRQRTGLSALATRIIAQQSGLPGLCFARGRAAVPPAHAAVPVAHQGQEFGLLHAPPPADAAALQPWALWLARWLALEWRTAGLWDMALRDELTGAWNRRYFRRFLDAILQRARAERFRVTVMVFDIDDFKTYNDRYGHAAGDQVLCETVRLMQSVVREHDVVARVGGDEFAVIFWDAEGPRRPHSEHPADVRKATRRFREAIRAHKFPKLGDEAPGAVSISGGLASFPWDGATADALLDRADQAALQSKREGKNAITFGPGASRERETNGET